MATAFQFGQLALHLVDLPTSDLSADSFFCNDMDPQHTCLHICLDEVSTIASAVEKLFGRATNATMVSEVSVFKSPLGVAHSPVPKCNEIET